ncbi:hypothetical protein [Hansschlegelia zhihuaiae]|uniref:Uncharacterized protein n=1 Tax=Hansschlegelia zhihuaiae TaxID=405005 RepID=A0A4Q0MGN3_9HYPH|nr:hypothetical protein [Hansschlegelia zhihuaiae]RXF72707.1 hypothetical protein EK403_14185 [Hansschlegelia zhihuaiae]
MLALGILNAEDSDGFLEAFASGRPRAPLAPIAGSLYLAGEALASNGALLGDQWRDHGAIRSCPHI